MELVVSGFPTGLSLVCIHRDGKGDDMTFGVFDHLDWGGGSLTDQRHASEASATCRTVCRCSSKSSASGQFQSSARRRRRHCPSYTQSKDTLQEIAIRETIVKSSRGKFLTLGDLRIGIRFEKVWDAFCG